ncbi:MAG: dehydrogenase [Bauldia sp.]|uniref:alpha-ketoacid dehydrogenase subunit alpha/beta n=1 Tax=Bauldia sp. TaxID=2575872 RepID=UPI001D5B6D1A|nr:alpha-ketoacid dehydrogenase subunit alpha/beta [Bauldia sp.]MCB1497425.1 dehydrogenase [Bauldia sp.]
MPKELFVDPQVMRKADRLRVPEIPVHAYATPLAEERQRYGDKTLIRVLRDMMMVREFETMLASFKAQGAYAGIEFVYKGPAHLSIGQEGAAVGSALALKPDDHIFGSHRSHGEFIAKGLSAIAGLEPAALAAIMEGHQGGAMLRSVEKILGGDNETEVAETFLLLGLLAEIFMRASGFNGGMGGSMHAFFLPFGAYPNNAIVGGSAGIATGAAMRKRLGGDGGITVAYSGDGSTGCGPVWEAMNFSSMAQLKGLWPEEHRGGLPVLFCFNNNFYAMGGQTIGETAGWDRLSRIGAGINPDAMHAETVDGTNPLAVADAVARKRALLVEGAGPALLDVECYRATGHSTSDANAYRSRDEIKAWTAHDPIALYAASLKEAGILDDTVEAALAEGVAARVRMVTAAAVDPAIAAPVDIRANPTLIGELMFSNTAIALPPEPVGTFNDPASTSRVRQLAKKARHGIDENGGLHSPMRAVTIRDALFETLLHHFTHDESLIGYGEECREWGGAFGVYRGLSDILPYDRLFNAPISEAAIVATAIGYAMEGGRAVVELMYTDFIGRAGDEIFNQMAKWQSMSAGMLKLPVVLRCSIGSKYGAQHSQDWSGLVAHIPGLKVVYPSTPYDAKGLLASALAGNDPVIFFESQRLYDATEMFHEGGVPEDYYQVPIGVPDVKREGTDVTILTLGPSLYAAVGAAETLAAEHGVSAEIIDARSLVPFDYETVLKSVRKTGRILLVSEASERGSFLMTLAADIGRYAHGDLTAPPQVLGSPNWIVPGAEMESTYFPQAQDIIDIVCCELIPEKNTDYRGLRGWDGLDLSRRGI